MKTDILIVGGGLAGLRLADLLHAQGGDFILVEARDRIGGRVLSEAVEGGRFDLGPSWFWSGQPRIAALIDRFGLQQFEQFSEGAFAYEDEHGQVQYGRGSATMQGSWRIEGGMSRLALALAQAIPAQYCLAGHPVVSLIRHEDGIEAILDDGRSVRAHQVILSIPPRVAAVRIAFSPPLSRPAIEAMRNVPTWMAGQAKAVAVYDEPFWRNAALSGDAMSRRGPLVEMHDASPARGGPYALFGFIGVPPSGRMDEKALRAGIVAQLGRIFGDRATRPATLLLKDWAFDPFTATEADHEPLHAHPRYGLPAVMSGLWDGTLSFGGTEVAEQFGGYVEGAFVAAEDAAVRLTNSLSHRAGPLP